MVRTPLPGPVVLLLIVMFICFVIKHRRKKPGKYTSEDSREQSALWESVEVSY